MCSKEQSVHWPLRYSESAFHDGFIFVLSEGDD